MSLIAEILINSKLVVVIVSAFGLAGMVTSILGDNNRQRKKAREHFLELVKGNIDKGIILDLNILGHIKQSVEREHHTEIVVSNMLQDILVKTNVSVT